jgi:hypothetical protein
LAGRRNWRKGYNEEIPKSKYQTLNNIKFQNINPLSPPFAKGGLGRLGDKDWIRRDVKRE